MDALKTDEQIIEKYVDDILDGKFEFESADSDRGETGSGINDALMELEAGSYDWTGEYEKKYKKTLLTYAVREFWNEFKPMRFYLPNVWDTWEDYLRKRLY